MIDKAVEVLNKYYVSRIPSIQDMSKITAKLVEKNFPKGQCKERGKAIVLHAEILIAIYDLLLNKQKGD